MSEVGVNFWYLAVQIIVLGIACATPLVVMWLAFVFVRRRNEQVRGELLATRSLTAEGEILLDAAWLKGHTAVEIYRRADGLYLRPITPPAE